MMSVERKSPGPVVRSPSGENRVMTIMFCDLQDSTKLAGQVDPEDLSEIVRAYQEAAVAAIHRRDGYVAQYLGDGLLVYFGYPRAHEDDAVRAVRAGLDLVARIQELNVALRRRFGLELAVRVGIHTGKVVVGEMGSGERTERLALGQAPNLAARIEGLAPPNGVVVSWATRELLGANVELEDLGEFELKGIEARCRVHRVVAVRALHGFEGRTVTAIVDRKDELARGLRAWSKACEGRGIALLLRGEAGIGKSRLVREIVALAALRDADCLVVKGQDETQLNALRPFTDALTAKLALAEPGEPAAFTRVEDLAAWQSPDDAAIVAQALGVRIPEGRAPSAMTPQVKRVRTLSALVRALPGCGSGRPGIVVAEDLHWFDPTSLELLGHVFSNMTSAPVLVIMTCRSEFESPWDVATVETIDLPRLPLADVATLVKNTCHDRVLPADLCERITERAEGVPLFAEELTKTLMLADPAQPGTREKLEHKGPLGDQTIPTSVYGCLMVRLDSFPAARQVAQLGAVIGRRFGLSLLRESAELGPEDLELTLADLVHSEVLALYGEGSEAVYEFRHALLRDAAEQSLLRATKRTLHARVAEALLRKFPEQAASEPEVVAHHLSAAGRGPEAGPYWRAAGLTAMGRFANQEAISYFSRALAAFAEIEDPGRRAGEELALTVLRAIPMMLTRGWGSPEVKAAYLRARDLCDLIGDAAPPELFPTLIGLGAYFIVTADWAEATRLMKQNSAIAERTGLDDLLVEVDAERGVVELYAGKPVNALPALDRVIAAYRPAAHAHHLLTYGRNVLAVAFTTRALTNWTLGFLDTAVSDARSALGAVDLVEHPFSRAWALSPNVLVHILRGEPELASGYTDQLCEFAQQHGFPYWFGQGLVFRGWISLLKGQPELALGDVERGLEIWYASGTRMLDPMMTTPLARVRAALGHYDAALRVVDASLSFVEETGECWWAPEVHSLKGEILERRDGGPSDAALTEYRTALALADATGAGIMRLRAATNLARVLGHRGEAAEGRAILSPIAAEITQGQATVDPVAARSVLATLL